MHHIILKLKQRYAVCVRVLCGICLIDGPLFPVVTVAWLSLSLPSALVLYFSVCNARLYGLLLWCIPERLLSLSSALFFCYHCRTEEGEKSRAGGDIPYEIYDACRFYICSIIVSTIVEWMLYYKIKPDTFSNWNSMLIMGWLWLAVVRSIC